ncbi:MAG: hypothetical protein M3N50_07845 [Pseudomonadota bacterium]|nr:hypothetical protein [Pseudomonadota bacterium]
MKKSIRIAPLLLAAALCYVQLTGAAALAESNQKRPAAAPDDLSGTWQRDFLAGSFAPPGIPSRGRTGAFPGGAPPPPPGGFPGGAPPAAPPGGFAGGQPPGPPPGAPGGGGVLPTQQPLSERVPTLPNGTVIPLRPQFLPLYRELEAKRDAASAYSTSKSGCKPLGTPENMMGAPPYPIRIVQKPNFIAILLEEGWYFRTIYMGGKHPEEINPSFNGHSIGHWEGKTLVVETVALREEVLNFISLPHSAEMRIVERIRRTAPDKLEDRIEINDPVMYSKPFAFTSVFNRTREEQIEYVCEDRTP